MFIAIALLSCPSFFQMGGRWEKTWVFKFHVPGADSHYTWCYCCWQLFVQVADCSTPKQIKRVILRIVVAEKRSAVFLICSAKAFLLFFFWLWWVPMGVSVCGVRAWVCLSRQYQPLLLTTVNSSPWHDETRRMKQFLMFRLESKG